MNSELEVFLKVKQPEECVYLSTHSKSELNSEVTIQSNLHDK